MARRAGMWSSPPPHQQNRDKMFTRRSTMWSAFPASWYGHGRGTALSSCSGFLPWAPHPGLLGLGTCSSYFYQPPRKDLFLAAMLSREFSEVWCLLVRISSRVGEKDDSATAKSSLSHTHSPSEPSGASQPGPTDAITRQQQDKVWDGEQTPLAYSLRKEVGNVLRLTHGLFEGVPFKLLFMGDTSSSKNARDVLAKYPTPE